VSGCAQLVSQSTVLALNIAELHPLEAMGHLRRMLYAFEHKGRIPDLLMCLALHKAGLLAGARYVGRIREITVGEGSAGA
jgi:hypothetical protein